MPLRTRWSVALVALSLTLLATPAMAIIPCENCEPGMPSWTRCIGFCNGQRVFYCSDWLAMGCPTWLAPEKPQSAEEAEEAFIRSLRLEPVEVPSE